MVDAGHARRAAAVAPGCPTLRRVLVTGGGTQPAIFPASITVLDYDAAIAAAPPVLPDNGRSGDDKIIFYTGGTTGLPKGVLWRHEDLYFSALSGANPLGAPHLSAGAVAAAARGRPPGGSVIAPPLMHASGTWLFLFALLIGSKAILSRKFDPAQVLRLVSAEEATGLGVIGDAMARPIADELAAHPDQYDLSSLVVLVSGGALLSRSVREQIQAMCPDLLIVDSFASSESGGTGELGQAEDGRRQLAPSESVIVLDEALRPVGPVGPSRRYGTGG